MALSQTAVIGAGVMGRGVAQNLATVGLPTILIDNSKEKLEEAKTEIINNIRMHIMFGGQQKKLSIEEIIERIEFTIDLNQSGRAEYIIENITENIRAKESLYKMLVSIISDDCIIAANTSAIPITQIASWTKRPENVIGIHFMNPVPMKATVELIPGYHTSEKTIETTKNDLLAKMGKEWVLVNDQPGFVSNRVLMLTINEAAFLVYENTASAEDVDKVFKNCFGHKMGPLETADLIGVDTILYSIEVLYECYNDSKFRPCPLLKKMVYAGLFGRKSGKGFYKY
jgi:3-hydroxybutyryl-CoA dehydrogenase